MSTPTYNKIARPDRLGSGVGLNADGQRLVIRRKQRLGLSKGIEGGLVVIESGCLTLDAVLASGRHQVMLLLYPGDVILPGTLPPLPRVGLTALTSASVMNRRPENSAAAPFPELGQADATTRVASMLARATLHTVRLASLTAEERFASLLVEMAFNLGSGFPSGYAPEVPMARAEMAGYLALNPDTLSRLMSRFRARNLISAAGRGAARIRDFKALCEMTPLGGTLQAMAGSAIVPRREAEAAGTRS